MKIKILVAALCAMAFTVPSHAQSAPSVPVFTQMAPTSAQVTAQLAALNIPAAAFPTGQSTSTLKEVYVHVGSFSAPIACTLTFQPDSNGGTFSYTFFPPSAAVTASIAAGPAPRVPISSPSSYVLLNTAGVWAEGLR